MSLPRLLTLPAALALVLAGCVAGEPEAADPQANPTSEEPVDDAQLDHESHEQAAAPPPEALAALESNPALTSLHTMSLYFTPEGALVDVLPAEGSVAFPNTMSKCFTQPPCGYFEFVSAPSTEPWALIPGPVVYDIWVMADAPVASTGIFDFGAWFGTNVGQSTSATVTHGNILPGEVVHVTWESQHPATPNVVFPGDSFQALLLAAMTQDGTQSLRLLTGGETPSQIRFTMARVDPAALALGAQSQESQSGALSGPGFPVSVAVGESDRTRAVHTFTIPETANLARFDITGRTPVAQPDLDVDLYFGETHIGEGHTPRETETMQLAGPALDGYRGQTVELVVTDFFGMQVEYDIVATYR